MQKEFDQALENLKNIDVVDEQSAAHYNEQFKILIGETMQIVNGTDYDALVKAKVEAAEKKYGEKVEFSEDATDAYKKLREVVRFEMFHESLLAGKEFEVCCTESNFAMAMNKIRPEIAKLVPENQKEAVDSIGYSIYSDFTKFLVCSAFDMVADAKIFEMPEFRPLQLNALGKEVRTNVNVVRQQKDKPQKSKVVTDWFLTVMMLPGLLLRHLYAVSLVEMFAVEQKQADCAAHLFNLFQKHKNAFSAGDEYEVLKDFLPPLGIADCFTVRPKVKDKPTGGYVN